jgi:SAM-dependent methyltransferase
MSDEIRNKLNITYNKYSKIINKSPLEKWRCDIRDNFLCVLHDNKVKTILELGCGSGKDAKYFVDHGFSMTCIDLSEEFIEICKGKGLNTFVLDYYELESLQEKFDCVYAQNSLLHVPKKDLELILSKINNCLLPDGIFYLGVFGGIDSEGIYEEDFYDPPRYFSSYTDQSIKEVTDKYFSLMHFETHLISDSKYHYQSLIMKKKII